MPKAALILISLVYPISEFQLQPSHTNGGIKRVVAIAVDGARESEAAPVFHELQKKLKELGLNSMWRGKDQQCTTSQPSNLSLPAYASVFSGHVQKNIMSNRFEGQLIHPTLFDQFPDSQLFSAWKPIIHSVSNDPDVLSKAYISGFGNKPGEDIWVMYSFRLVHDFNNRFMFIHLGDADEFAHVGAWGAYTDAIRTEADNVHEIIQTSELAGVQETLYYIFSDHSRGTYRWQEHGNAIPESNAIWVIEVSPLDHPLMTGACNHIAMHDHILAALSGK